VSSISERKRSHLQLCAEADVESGRSTLLEDVQLLHEALPELAWDEVDPSVELFGRRLHVPLLVSGMTGGTPEARELNRTLAAVAQKTGRGMGVGSQRAMWRDGALADTYRVRDVAPDVLLLANLGVVQAREAGVDAVAELVSSIGADALCVHLNVAQELVQDEGDRDFRGALATLSELARDLAVPLVVKETGCGFSRTSLARLREAGVGWVDVAGAGGTSWTAVESLRGSPRQRALGGALRDWGVPTAAAVAFAREAGLHAIASGGIRGALDAVRALALGARAASMALPFLRAYARAGPGGVLELAQALAEGIRALMLLVGARRTGDLDGVPRVLGPRLRDWLGGPEHEERR
jgi:isopentenyl-diphosphate delta-isomerase